MTTYSDWQDKYEFPTINGIYHIMHGSSLGWSYFENGKWTLPDFRLTVDALPESAKENCHRRRKSHNFYGPYTWRGILDD